MSKISWKKGAVISIESREKIYFLAQMIEEPYLYFFDIHNDSHEWQISSLENVPPLFCVAVVRQFLRNGNIKKMDIAENPTLRFPSYWIQRNLESQMYTIWEGTSDEMTFAMSKAGGTLVERSLKTAPQNYVKIKNIDDDENNIIDSYELTSLRSYPELNERLYLSYLLGKNIDPLKEIMFNRPLIKEFKVYMQILTGKLTEIYR